RPGRAGRRLAFLVDDRRHHDLPRAERWQHSTPGAIVTGGIGPGTAAGGMTPDCVGCGTDTAGAAAGWGCG
ncbi:MAG: hypothetical protein ACKOC4_14415, partial [Planctomycetia bacterium]